MEIENYPFIRIGITKLHKWSCLLKLTNTVHVNYFTNFLFVVFKTYMNCLCSYHNFFSVEPYHMLNLWGWFSLFRFNNLFRFEFPLWKLWEGHPSYNCSRPNTHNRKFLTRHVIIMTLKRHCDRKCIHTSFIRNV